MSKLNNAAASLAVIGFWIFGIAVSVAVPVGVIYVAIHFLRKIW